MPISPTALRGMLQAEKTDSLGIGAATLANERARAMNYYNGDMTADMPSQEGRSSAVSTDVADTVEGLMPGLMEIFASGEEVVRFEPVGEEDEEAAEQETDYVNHVFMQKNPGFMVLYSLLKDALLSKVGIVKVDWEIKERQERETYHDVPDDVYQVMAAAPDVEVLEHTKNGDEAGGITHDVTLVTRKKYGCAKVMPVPPEEFGVGKRTRTISDCNYCYHEPANVTEDDLIEQGYDAVQIKALPSAGDLATSQEKLARDTIEKEKDTSQGSDSLNRALRYIRVTEHYIRMDYDDSGVQLYRVTTGGEQMDVLKKKDKPDVVPVDVIPFAVATPIPVTHRFFGRSLADIVMDIQRIKTALLRALLDNAYLANNQRMEVAESHAGERTLDDLLVNRPGGLIRTKVPGGLLPIPNQPIGNFAFPLIEYIDATREFRSGVTKQGQGLDANALQNQSATAVNQAFTAAQAKMKLIARILAETGIRDLFSLLHATIRKNDDRANTVKLRNKWVQVDPREWKTRDDMTINVGLGSGSRMEQVQHLMMLLGLQKEALMAPQINNGGAAPLVKVENVYKTVEKLVERIGLKTVEPYFNDPTKPEVDPQTGQPKPPAQPPPDPKMAEVQGKLQIEGQKAQSDAQLGAAKHQASIQGDMAKAQADGQAAQQRMVMEAQLKREQMAAEFQLKREQFAEEMALRREESQRSHDLKREMSIMSAGAKENSAISPVRFGGEVG